MKKAILTLAAVTAAAAVVAIRRLNKRQPAPRFPLYYGQRS
jgi:hypothetical protein